MKAATIARASALAPPSEAVARFDGAIMAVKKIRKNRKSRKMDFCRFSIGNYCRPIGSN